MDVCSVLSRSYLSHLPSASVATALPALSLQHPWLAVGFGRSGKSAATFFVIVSMLAISAACSFACFPAVVCVYLRFCVFSLPRAPFYLFPCTLILSVFCLYASKAKHETPAGAVQRQPLDPRCTSINDSCSSSSQNKLLSGFFFFKAHRN